MAKSKVSRSLLMTLALTVALAGCAPGESEPESVGPMGMFHDGSSRAWSSFEGDYLLVNYWAEWCKPCRKEIPELNELDHEDGISVVGVNFDGIKGDELLDLMDRLGVEFPVALEDPREVWGVDPVEVLPTTIVVDPQGRAKRVLIGPQTAATLRSAMAAP